MTPRNHSAGIKEGIKEGIKDQGSRISQSVSQDDLTIARGEIGLTDDQNPSLTRRNLVALSTDQLMECLGRLDRFWPQAPRLTPPQVGDWRRTLGRFQFESVSQAIDFWAGAKPKFRPDLTEVLAKVQEFSRENTPSASPYEPYVRPTLDGVAPSSVARESLAECRRVLGAA